MQITSPDSLSTDPFADLPTALKTIVGRLDDWLQARPKKPPVANPVLPTEPFGDLWLTDEQYENFRDKVNLYRGWIDEAYDDDDRDESIGKWRRVFGDTFAPDVVLDKSTDVVEGARLLARASVHGSSNLVLDARDDLVGLVRRYGLSVLPPRFEKLAYKRQPVWRRTPHGDFEFRAGATLHASKGAPSLRGVASGQPLPKDHHLRFDVDEVRGSIFPWAKYRVHWRITNTGREAADTKCLRGGFEDSDDGTARWEYLKFRGVHMAEAFVVRLSDGMLVGESPPFYVMIE